jgi:hypothetical protein
VAALEGARRFSLRSGKSLKECFEAWIPDKKLDRRDEDGVLRMQPSDGITVCELSDRTALGRRLAMVASIDLLVTIAGRKHTEVVVEHALELGVPVLPVPDADGDSAQLLKDYRARIAASFARGALDRCLEDVSVNLLKDESKAAARAVVELMKTAKVGKCLVLLPFHGDHRQTYDEQIRPAIEQHMIPFRLDEVPTSELIHTNFNDAIRSATAIVADVTTDNLNVMYEIGYARAQGLTPLLFTLEERKPEAMPIYLRSMNVRTTSLEKLGPLIDEYLRDIKQLRKA